jgi:succinoglycan biosynthesis protein ExoM
VSDEASNPVTVIVPTLRRPESLERALRSLMAQTGGNALIAEVTIVDNDPEGSARTLVEALRRQSPHPLLYVHAPHPGVATARNAGLAATAAPLVAFLDDDESASPTWLSNLYGAHTAFGADVTFGPVAGRTEGAQAWKRVYLESFFSRTGPATSGLTEAVHGCGNSMMTRASALAGPAPFDTAANETGGEDDRLFQRLKASGAKFAWAADALVLEHAPPHRSTLAYALQRAFGYGQTPAQIAARSKDISGVLKWMLIGLAQGVVFTVAALAVCPFGRQRSLPYADRAARGFGKVVWFKTLKFYGSSVLRKAGAGFGARLTTRPPQTPPAASIPSRRAAVARTLR